LNTTGRIALNGIEHGTERDRLEIFMSQVKHEMCMQENRCINIISPILIKERHKSDPHVHIAELDERWDMFCAPLRE
jgi:hypothetical protein